MGYSANSLQGTFHFMFLPFFCDTPLVRSNGKCPFKRVFTVSASIWVIDLELNDLSFCFSYRLINSKVC